MLSGSFRSIPLDSIIVEPSRQRKEFKGIEELASSISEVGQINPIVVTPDFILVAGERRLRAHQLLGLTHILAQLTTDLPQDELEVIELEENIKRKDLTWREELDGICRIHQRKLSQNAEWNQTETAKLLSIGRNKVNDCLMIQRFIEAGDTLVENADTFTTAKNIALRKSERAMEEVDAKIDDLLSKPISLNKLASARTNGQPSSDEEELPIEEPKPDHPYLNESFIEWASVPFEGKKFNFLHCDFPYGINFDKHNSGATGSFGEYSDTPELYAACLSALEKIMSTHIAPSAHLLFWLSARQDIITPTIERLTEMGWKVNPVPLIWWRNDNSGILPDPQRGPRQVYEVALMASRGDRKIVQAVSNLIGCPKSKEIHASEKPRDMLSHFFRMFIDTSTIMLDPTMGSGNSILVAERMGAASCLGLEIDKGFFTEAIALRKRVMALSE